MKTFTFIAITLLAGAIAGTILGAINQVIVEPFIERAIALENQNAANSGELINPIEFSAYRLWQKGGEIAAGTILGLSLGSLFGIVFAYARDSIPGSSNKKKALLLAGIMWFVLFLVPALKYPANPPAVGDPETIYYRQQLYIVFLAISGFSALGLAFLYRKMGALQSKKVMVPAAYAAIMACAYLAVPSNPDTISAPMDLVLSFRFVSVFTMSVFWGVLGTALGSFWDKLKPHESASIRTL
ncbi:MAG TPA: CbtA family protein [Nitrososphaera sp.]|jgi:predicted cobalt transporter CbtA|nr:CbtA family protein [Nitrososphaera sp.]